MKQSLSNLDKLPVEFERNDFLIRRSKASDIPKLVEIINRGFSYQDKLRGRPRITNEEQQALMEEDIVYIVKNHAKESVATYAVYEDPSEPLVLHLARLVVAQDYLGQGIAGMLMKNLEQIARSVGYKTIYLNYMHIAPSWLPEFYHRLGYQDVHDSMRVWQGIEISSMTKEL